MAKYVKDLIVGILILAVVIAAGIAIVNHNSNKTEETKTDNTISTNEAQIKCTLMEEADLVNLMGEPFGDATTKKAEESCLAQWDKSKNSNNTEEKFKEVVEMDWESRKTEVLEGYTLEEYYNESVK